MVAERRLGERRDRAFRNLGDRDIFEENQVRPGGSRLDDVRFLIERLARQAGNLGANYTPLGYAGRFGRLGADLLGGAPDVLDYLTEARGPNQPIETALAASEAGMGAGASPGPSNPAPPGYHRMRDGTLMQDTPGMTYDSGQPPLGAPAAGAPLPPTPPGGLTRGDSAGALPTGGMPPMRRVDDIASGYPDTASGLQSTALAPLPSSTSMIGQRVETTPGVAGSLSRVDDIASSYSPRRLGAGMPGQTAAGLPLPSTLVGGGGARGMSPIALEEVQKNPFLMADILNQQRGRSPTTDMWAAKERGDATRLGELFPLFDDPNNPDDMAEQAAYLQRGIEGRRQPGGRLDFRGALLAKLGDEAGSGEVLDGLGIPMSIEPGQLPAAAQRAGQLVNAVQVQGGRLPAMAAARAQRVQEEIIRQHSLALQSGEEFGQPQISAIIRSLA